MDPINTLVGGSVTAPVHALVGVVFLVVATILCGRVGRTGAWLSAPWVLALLITAAFFFTSGLEPSSGALSDGAVAAFARGADLSFLVTMLALAIFGGTA